MKPLVYVAGPITANPWGCIRQAVPVAERLTRIGAVPYLPQLTILHEIVSHQPYERWMEHGLAMVEHCDALIYLPGESPGADREIAHARSLGLPVFYSDHAGDWDALCRWIARWAPRAAGTDGP